MNEKFQKYTLEKFLDDPDFCAWARSERPDLDEFYRQVIEENPGQKNTFQKAYQLVRLFDDEKLRTEPTRKLQIWEEINTGYRQKTPSKRYKLILRYAAVLTFLVSISSLTYYFVSVNTQSDFATSFNAQDISETKLILDNGEKINIEADRSEIVYDQRSGRVKVNDELVQKGEETTTPGLNQVIVPFGKQSKIILADRTEVWLNAGSRLIYPSVFKGGKRKVQLQGEAFFKVSKDKSNPFFVETNHSTIKVLGTSFNVKAYSDEKVEETVLVEGAVNLYLGKTIFGKEIRLNPDQRLVVSDTDHSYSISKVDVRNYTSWIEGLFVFNEEPLPSVLMRISRFYDLRIKWINEVENLKISGKLDLKDDYQRVLNALALISDGTYVEKDQIIYFKLK